MCHTSKQFFVMDHVLCPEKLSLNKFPTNADIMRAYIYEREKWLLNNGTEKEPKISIVSKLIAKQVRKIYKNAKIKTIKKNKIKEKVTKIYKSRLNLLKIPRSKRCSKMFSKKMELYNLYISQLFEITTRNCTSVPKRSNEINKQKKMSIDNTQTTGNRAAALVSRQKSYALAMYDENKSDENGYIINNDEQIDPDFEALQSNVTTFKSKSLDLSEIVELKSRFTGSDRYTSAIVNATLRMVGIPPSIDKSKLRRAQDKHFAEIRNEPVKLDIGGGLYYDSRKDSTITSRKRTIDGKFKFYRRILKVEHYTLVSQPEGIFLGFVKAKEGSAKCASEEIISFSKEKKIFDTLQALGSDGTNVNVGWEGGINQYIEAELKRPLHWFVCLLHANELPLKKLMITLDGKTSGAKSFSGPIGKALVDVGDKPIVAFKKFKLAKKLEKIPEDVLKMLSNDQKYLYNIVNALISGKFPETLAETKIGNLNHSRWVTTASRICKLYAATVFPSETLKILTSYIVEVYAPTWFQIKRNELAINGPENLFFLIKKSNMIKNKKAKAIVQKRIRRNAFFAHSENVLLAQLSSRDKRIRTDAVNKILYLRERISDDQIRIFKVPEIDFAAKSWTGIGILTESNMFEPPFTINMNEDELLAVIEEPLAVPKFKCHTQMVERAVKEVTRVSHKIVDLDKRNSMVKATLINRAKFPKFDSLKDHSVENHKKSCYLPKI